MSQDDNTPLETRLELFATVALLAVTAVVRVLQTKDAGSLDPAALEQLRAVRVEVEGALGSLDTYLAEPGGTRRLDLSGLRDKLASMVRTLDEWPVGSRNLPA